MTDDLIDCYKDVEKLMNDLEKLKDKVRDNGNHS